MQFMWQTFKNLSRLCFAKILAVPISAEMLKESILSIVLSVFYCILYYYRAILLVVRARMFKNSDLKIIRKILSYCYLGDWWVSIATIKNMLLSINFHFSTYYPKILLSSTITQSYILWLTFSHYLKFFLNSRCFINWDEILTRTSFAICCVILNMISRSKKNELKEKKEDAFEDQLNISMEENKVIQKV